MLIVHVLARQPPNNVCVGGYLCSCRLRNSVKLWWFGNMLMTLMRRGSLWKSRTYIVLVFMSYLEMKTQRVFGGDFWFRFPRVLKYPQIFRNRSPNSSNKEALCINLNVYLCRKSVCSVSWLLFSLSVPCAQKVESEVELRVKSKRKTRGKWALLPVSAVSLAPTPLFECL